MTTCMPNLRNVIHACTQTLAIHVTRNHLGGKTCFLSIPSLTRRRCHLHSDPLIPVSYRRLAARASSTGDQLSQEEVIQQLEAGSQGQNGGSSSVATDAGARKNLMHEAIAQLAVQNLEEAAAKYNLEEELFAEIDFVQVNAFTDAAFGGNPAAVCYLPLERDAQWMQSVAKQFNLSETAFLVKRRTPTPPKNTSPSPSSSEKTRPKGFGDLIQKNESGSGLKASSKFVSPSKGGNEFDLWWFTPNGEVRLCGHATLAAAHMIFAARLVQQDFVLFHTKSGVLTTCQVAESSESEPLPPGLPGGTPAMKSRKRPSGRGTYELDFPMELACESGGEERGKVGEALGGVEMGFVGRSSLDDVLVELPSEEAVLSFRPNSSLISAVECRGVIITAPGSKASGVDFVSRFFAPRFGIPEDPVTGSAHCSLGPYWEEKLGKKELRAFQASERGGHLAVRVDREAGRVYIQGNAVMVMAGTLLNTVRTKTE